MNKNVVFFGDSLTVGEGNNNISFANYFASQSHYKCDIHGVSGACFGNYSIYPVEDNLLSLIFDYQHDISNADLIVIEFGLNDTAAVATGYATFKQVCVSIVKAIDCIMQYNPDVKIIFIDPSNQNCVNFATHMHNYIKYLNNEYFLNYSGLSTSFATFLDIYLKLVDFITKIKYNNIKVLSVPKLLFADDGIHFNDNGHEVLAEKLRLFVDENSFFK